MGARDCIKDTDSAKVEMGEIDTSSPIQSVKDAVTRFGAGAFSGEKPAIKKPRPHSAKRIFAKETQLHLAKKELSKIQEQIKNAETTKAQELEELEKARKTAEDLAHRLKTVTESKISAFKTAEAAKDQAKQFEEAKRGNSCGTDSAEEEDLEPARKQYMTLIEELDTSKQRLRNIQQDCDAISQEKIAALKQAAEAEEAARTNMERADELSREISAVQESVAQVNLASKQAQEDHDKIFTEKDLLGLLYKISLEEKLLAMKEETDPTLIPSLEAQLAETVNEIGALQNEMESIKALDLEAVRSVTFELDDAKDSLQKVFEEESSFRGQVEAIKAELESVKNEQTGLREKEAQQGYLAGNLQDELEKREAELEVCLAEESKLTGSNDEMISALNQLASETDTAHLEAKDMKCQAEELKKEAEATRISIEQTGHQLKLALDKAEEAKVAEARALNQVKVLSERTSSARASTSSSGANITLSKEEFESLRHKVEESDELAELKVAAAMAQVEAINASEREVHKRLEITQKEIEDMEAATEEALKKAEMAEAAKRAVEGELRRRREREQNMAAEAASRILAENQISSEPSPLHYNVQKHDQAEKIIQARKLQKAKTSVSKKTLMHSLSGMLHKN